uniref:Apextrin n=1 Tax=Heliocidaris erythrogramma TaxID=7634 RepID=O76288_HELER|nr:apextrin [Heliocidaris erythrogramma]
MVGPRTACGGLLILFSLLPVISLGASTLPIPNPMKYIGIGYNIIDGNPEGDNRVAGGVDPGLLVSRRIFELTYDNGKTTNDNEYRVPDEVEFQQRSSSFTSKETDTFYGTKSYAKKLSHQVQADASVEAVFASVKFSASHRYESISNDASTKGYVYSSEQTIQNFGHMRYLTSLAEHDGFEIAREFRIDVCDLPTTYATNTYMEFLSKWGTSVVTEADVGVRTGINSREDRSSFVKDASTDMSNSVSVEGNYKIFSASLSVDMDRFSQSASSEKKMGTEYTRYTIGSEEFNEPITISLIGLEEALNDEYWSRQSEYESSGECPSNWARSTIATNILTGLKEYANYRGVVPSSDPDVTVPLTWPDGKYALPEAVTLGDNTCPNTDYMTWSFGLFYQFTDDGGVNTCSENNHLTNYCERTHMRTYYCVKTTPKATDSSWSWMPGVYCIFKNGDTCLTGSPMVSSSGTTLASKRALTRNITQCLQELLPWSYRN